MDLRAIPFLPPSISGGVGCPTSPPVSPPVSCPTSTTPPPPPAIPGLIGSPAGAVPGSVWVDGATLNYIASNGAQYQGTGVSQGSPVGAVPGSMYVDGSGGLVYIDASGVARTLQSLDLGVKTNAVTGSTYIDSGQSAGRQFAWINTSSHEFQWSNGN